MRPETVAEMVKLRQSKEAIRRKIERLDVSADIKVWLDSFFKATIRAGEFVIHIGQKILESLFDLIKEFRNAGVGLIFGALLGLLVGSIPVIDFVLGPIVGPIAMAFGFAYGGIQDIKNGALAKRIQEASAPYAPLATV